MMSRSSWRMSRSRSSRRGQEGQGIAAHHGGRVGVEGDDGAEAAQLAGAPHGLADEVAVAQVHPIEDAQREHHARSSRPHAGTEAASRSVVNCMV